MFRMITPSRTIAGGTITDGVENVSTIPEPMYIRRFGFV